MVFMHREYKLLLAFAAVLIVGILVSPLGTNTAIAFVAGAVSSATAGYLGMYAATKANVRTAVAANTEARRRRLTLPSTAAQSWASAWRHWVFWGSAVSTTTSVVIPILLTRSTALAWAVQ